jgi:signal transduction histidine kinase
MGASRTAPHVVLLGNDDATLEAVERAVRRALPGATVDALPPDVVIRSVGAHCVVLDGQVGGRRGVDVLRALRAGGYEGGVVLLGATVDPEASTAARRFGAEGPVAVVGEGAARADDVAGAVARALDAATRPDDRSREAWRTRQLVAAGELALSLQHAINNPLTAMLAEAQLLEMDLPDGEQRAAVGRILELCRRTIAVARQLDDVAPSR